jgi:LAS superfamily LD-carboxypeptidase LdcB
MKNILHWKGTHSRFGKILFFLISLTSIIAQDDLSLGDELEKYLTGNSGSKMTRWQENGRTHLFRPDAKLAFQDMMKSYNKDRKENPEYKSAPEIKPLSGFRSYQDQQYIWNSKFKGERKMKGYQKDLSDWEKAKLILEYSSAPGTSRHHWGTDMDINSFDNDYFEKGSGKLLYKWLQENAHKFGFCQPYTSFSEQRTQGYFQGRNLPEEVFFPNTKTQVKGYFQENWHWSYAPISQRLVKEWEKYYESKGKNPVSILGKNTLGYKTIEPKIPWVYVTAVNKGCDEVLKNFYEKKNTTEEYNVESKEVLEEDNLSIWDKILAFFWDLFT